MGAIVASMELENAVDRGMSVQGLRDEAAVRRTRVDGIVDAGGVTLVLPQNVVERLGLATQRTVIVTYADERKEECPVAGPVTVRIGARFGCFLLSQRVWKRYQFASLIRCSSACTAWLPGLPAMESASFARQFSGKSLAYRVVILGPD